MRNPAPPATPEALNQSWSVDFMHDALICGRRFRTFNIVDDFNREALAIEIDLNIPAQRVVRVLDRIVATRGYPVKIRMDNGPELISLTLAHWAEEYGVILKFIKPGKPTQNVFIERFNRTYRTEILDYYLFRTLNEVREITGENKVTVATREYGKTREDICTFVFQPQVTASNGIKTKFYYPDGFGQAWNALIKKSGVRHRKAYQTLHTYACWMLSAGANPAFIATQMGHVSSKMIHDVYGAWMKENDADQIAIMNNNAPPMPQVRCRKVI